MATSTDLTTWTIVNRQLFATTEIKNNLVFKDGYFVAVGYNTISISTNGVVWRTTFGTTFYNEIILSLYLLDNRLYLLKNVGPVINTTQGNITIYANLKIPT
jgi:hypothetical protein